MIDLAGRVAVVTGAGRGLGRSHALHLAERGARVVVNDPGVTIDGSGTDHRPADAVVDEIRARDGQAVAEHSSVATPNGGRAIIQQALETFGGIDIVVCNAGILRDDPLAELDIDDVRAVLDVHLLGTIHVVQPAWHHLTEQGYGRIVLTTSTSALFGNPGQSAYAAAKAGIVGLTRVWALEGASHDIAVNAVAPGAATRMTPDLPQPLTDKGPELVSPVVVYLASQDCTVTGQTWFAGAGLIRRIFTGTGPGHLHDARQHGPLQPEDIADQLDDIQATDTAQIPASMTEDLSHTITRLQG